MSRTQLVLTAVIIFLVALFSFSVWKSGEKEREARQFVRSLGNHIHLGANRMEIEAYLQYLGAYSTYDAPTSPGGSSAVRAMLFDVRRDGARREDLQLVFHFGPEDELQDFSIRRKMVPADAPRAKPEPQPSWARMPDIPADAVSTEAGAAGAESGGSGYAEPDLSSPPSSDQETPAD